jgi:hypothetical protein
VQFTFVVHRESLTFDEGDHSFSGYMMWKTGDYGLNPEHPPRPRHRTFFLTFFSCRRYLEAY